MDQHYVALDVSLQKSAVHSEHHRSCRHRSRSSVEAYGPGRLHPYPCTFLCQSWSGKWADGKQVRGVNGGLFRTGNSGLWAGAGRNSN